MHTLAIAMAASLLLSGIVRAAVARLTGRAVLADQRALADEARIGMGGTPPAAT